jgi:hypothetical protein
VQAFTRVSYYHSQAVAAHCFAELGEFDQAMLHAEWGVKFAQTLDMLTLHAFADAVLGSVHLRKGNLQEALHFARRWLQTYAAADLPVPELIMATNGLSLVLPKLHVHLAKRRGRRSQLFAGVTILARIPGRFPEREMTLCLQRPHAQLMSEHQGLSIGLSSPNRIRRGSIAVNVA